MIPTCDIPSITCGARLSIPISGIWSGSPSQPSSYPAPHPAWSSWPPESCLGQTSRMNRWQPSCLLCGGVERKAVSRLGWMCKCVRLRRGGAAMLLEMRGAPAVALTGVGAQANEGGRRETEFVEKIGPLAVQACGKGTGTIGSRSWGLGVVVFFESKCPKRGGGVPLRNSTSDQDGEGPCRLVACPLSACSCMCTHLGSQKHSRGAPGPQLLAASCVWACNNFSAVSLCLWAGISAPSSELRDRLRATSRPTVFNQLHATTTSLQHLTLDLKRPSLDSHSLDLVELQNYNRNNDGTRRRKSRRRRTSCAAPAHQFHFQASPATLSRSDLAVRTGTSA